MVRDVTIICANPTGETYTAHTGWDADNSFFNGRGDIARLFCEGGFIGEWTTYISDNYTGVGRFYNGIQPTPTVNPSPEPSVAPEPLPSPSPSESATVVTETATVVVSPSPEPTPQPSPSESQTVLIVPSDTPTQTATVVIDTPTVVVPPSPAPEPTPIPDPPVVVQPDPVVIPTPEPRPEPAPEPPLEAPEPTPEVEEEASALEEILVPEPVPDVAPEPVPEPEIEPELPLEVAPEEPALPEPEPDLPPDLELEPELVIDLAPEPPVVAPDATDAEKQIVALAIIEQAHGEPVTAQAIQDAGLTYEDLPPETPVEVRQDENGNEVVITAEVAAALVVLENPAALVAAIFTDPAQVLLAFASIGADMSDEERTESEKIIIASVIAGQAAVTAASAAGAYRRKP
jgi:hypothetical protein